jgi:uncharacterized protein (DUF2336 family)
MSAPQSRYAKLLELATVSSSETRRELLREVTDLFFESDEQRTRRETDLFDEVLQAVATDMQDSVLIELGRRFADSPNPPARLMRDLANHNFGVAEQVLRRCTSLTDDDLLHVLSRHGQDHARAIAARPIVSERVSDAIVATADDATLDILVRNDGAQITRAAMEVVVDRARESSLLHEGLVMRPDLPLDLLNEMYFLVEQRLRSAILARNAEVDPAELDLALNRARSRLQVRAQAQSRDARAAADAIAKLKAQNGLTGAFLVQCLRERMPHHFVYAFCEITGVDAETMRQVLARRDIDALAMISRASKIERALFVTIAMLIAGGEKATEQAEAFGKIYAAVPVEAAQRAMRFFKVRKAAEDESAAA